MKKKNPGIQLATLAIYVWDMKTLYGNYFFYLFYCADEYSGGECSI